MLEEQVFDPKRHDRTAFHCGEPPLDDYLRKYAQQQRANQWPKAAPGFGDWLTLG